MGLAGGTLPVSIGGQEFLAGGDIILEVMGIQVTGDRRDVERIMPRMRQLKSGQSLKFSILRNGKVKKMTYKLP